MLYSTIQRGWVRREREARHRRYPKLPHADVNGRDAVDAIYKTDGASLTLLQLLLAKLPQLVDLRRRAGDSPFDNIRTPAQRSPSRNCICCCESLDLDDTNPRVFRSSIMLAIFQVAKPCLQGRRIVFADHLTISDNVGFAGNRGPFAGGVEEGNVDLRFGLEVIGFAGFGVGVEEEVNAATFL